MISKLFDLGIVNLRCCNQWTTGAREYRAVSGARDDVAQACVEWSESKKRSPAS